MAGTRDRVAQAGGPPAAWRVACIQTHTGCDPAENLARLDPLVREAAGMGAAYIQTPEMSNVFEAGGKRQYERARPMEEDAMVAAMRDLAAELEVAIHLGSVAVRVAENADGARLANRSVLVAPSGKIAATYDKVHLFDADPKEGERYRESSSYVGGDRLVTAPVGPATLGLSICYDLRFPRLYDALALAGAQVLAVPAAFSATTGAKHWHTLLCARAIETGCFVAAAAQSGRHENGRETYGHSLIVSPDGAVLTEMPNGEGVIAADLDLAEVEAARRRLPTLANRALDRALASAGSTGPAPRGDAPA